MSCLKMFDPYQQKRVDIIFNKILLNDDKNIDFQCLNVPFQLTRNIIDNLNITQLKQYPLLATALKMVYDETQKERILILTPKYSRVSFVWISSTRTSLNEYREVTTTTIDNTHAELDKLQHYFFKWNDVTYNGILITTITHV
jgi:hypothetical protein